MRTILMAAVAAAMLSFAGLAHAAQPAAPVPNQFSAEADAKAHCPADQVVWANNKSKIYHLAGTKGYGTTKKGAYMCQKDSDAAGFRAAKPRRPKTPKPA
jgi:hypothetical protein